jgi:hypothetical protein
MATDGCARRVLVFNGARTAEVELRGLTFELTGRQRQDARPGLVKMYRVPPARAWWPAVGSPVERGVRHQCAPVASGDVIACEPFCLPLSATARAVAVLRVCGACHGCSWALCALQGRPLLRVCALPPADNAEAPAVLSLHSFPSSCPGTGILPRLEPDRLAVSS